MKIVHNSISSTYHLLFEKSRNVVTINVYQNSEHREQ